MHIPPHPNSRDCIGRVGIGGYAYGADTCNITSIFLSNENLTQLATCPPVPLCTEKVSISGLTVMTTYVTEHNKIKKYHKCLNTGLPVPMYKPLLWKLILRYITKKKNYFHVCFLYWQWQKVSATARKQNCFLFCKCFFSGMLSTKSEKN